MQPNPCAYAAPAPSLKPDSVAGFIDISGPISVPGVERATSSFLETNTASFPMRFYRLRITAP